MMILFSFKSSVSVRVVNQLLTEMDGLVARKQVFIMGATNRPGEFNNTLYLLFNVALPWQHLCHLFPGRTSWVMSCSCPSGMIALLTYGISY